MFRIIYLNETSFLLSLPKDIPNKFIVEQVKSIPFASFDHKRNAWRIPIYALYDTMKILNAKEKDIPEQVLLAYSAYVRLKQFSIDVYYDAENYEVKLFCRNDAEKVVKDLCAKYSDKNGRMKLSLFQDLINETKEKGIVLNISKNAQKVLLPEVYANKIMPVLLKLYPSYPKQIRATFIEGQYKSGMEICEICKGVTSKVFVIRSETGVYYKSCPLCASLVLDERTFKRAIRAIKKKEVQHRSSIVLFISRLFSPFRFIKNLKLFLWFKGLFSPSRSNKVKMVVERIAEHYDRTIAEREDKKKNTQ